MSDARWTRIERIYHAAAELPPCDRLPFVRNEAGDDLDLATEVMTLLGYDDRPAAFMRHSAMELAARALAEKQQLPEREPFAGAVGAYEIVRPIASGGMGDVYLAHDRRLARNIALKVLRSGAPDLDWIAASRREALAASALNHPNILTIHEIGEHQGTSFIASEFVDGVTLRERLKDGALALPELVGVALQIAQGLAAAHDAGVVHRDIKPDNVMLRADGLVKILDFGIATRTASNLPPVPSEPLEVDGVVIGTTGYMSPEQSEGRPVDATTDVWSLGVVICEMATGRAPALPVRSDSETSPQGRATPPLQELEHLPTELLPIVTRALSIDRAARHATAGELAVELRALSRRLEGRSEHDAAAAWHIGQRVGGGIRRRWQFGVAAIMLLAVAACLVVVSGRVRESRPVTSIGAMARELAGAFALPRQTGAGTEETRDPAAYQLYAKGRYHVLKRTPDDLRKGLTYLREAVALDPTYGRAYAKLADGYILLAMTNDVAPRESFPQARTAAERALAIDPGLSEARVSMGIIKFWFDWDWSGAEAEFKRAIAADGRDPAAHMFYGHLLSNLGDHTGALQEMRRALDYEPHSALANALFAQCLYYQGRHDESLAHLRTTLALDPSLWLTHNMTARIYGLKGMTREALLSFSRASELGGSLVVRANAGYTLAASGRRDEARAILQELKNRAAQGYVPASNLALVHLGLGEYDAALDRLEEAVAARDLLVTFLTVEPRWAALAGQPRFAALLGEIGLRQ